MRPEPLGYYSLGPRASLSRNARRPDCLPAIAGAARTNLLFQAIGFLPRKNHAVDYGLNWPHAAITHKTGGMRSESAPIIISTTRSGRSMNPTLHRLGMQFSDRDRV